MYDRICSCFVAKRFTSKDSLLFYYKGTGDSFAMRRPKKGGITKKTF